MKKDNKRMKITTYIKRIIAVAVSTAMLISMTPEVFAESLSAPESAISDPPVEETITENTQSDSQPVAVDESTGSAVSESTGTEETEGSVEQSQETTPEESTGTGESDGSTDRDSVASAEETMETIASDDVASEEFISEETTGMPPEDLVEEESEIELMLDLLAEGDSTIRTSPSLSLSDALNIAGTGNSTVLSESGNTLSVTGSKGLILLSNVQPEQYNTLDIELKTTEDGWNVTEQQVYTYTETVAEGGESGSPTTITCSFLGLGNEEHPYAGTMTIAGGSEGHSITANRALFNAISTDATLPSNINFMMAGNKSGQIVLADQVIKGNKTEKPTLECKVTLTTGTGADAATSDTIGGIIGTLDTGASANVTLTNKLGTPEKLGTLIVSGGEHRGLFCNTMASGSSLTASLTNSGNATITVTATSGDAGGYIGHMDGNNTLTISGKAVNTVTSNSGNAGGLVGSATDATINVTGEAPFYLSGVTVTASSNAGGLVGNYSNSETTTIDLAQFTLSTTLSSGSDSNVGGVFGTLTNKGSYTISNGSVTSNLTAGTNYGGLIGKYEAQANGETPARNASLTISSITGDNKITSTGGNYATTYGGVIGTVSSSSYVAMDDVSVSTAAMPTGNSSCFGGLVGKMENGLLNVGNVTLVVLTNNKGVPIYDISADDVGGRGGLVGYIAKGVLRLHGTTDLTNQKITTAYHHTGQIVGNNKNGLVYATGSGNSLGADGNGWLLKRYNNSSRSGSDIGNWGEVVRLDGTTLTEGADGLLTFDSNAHTVTVQGASVTTGDDGTQSVTLTNTRDFAAYALAFDFDSNTNYNVSDSNAVLSFATKVDPSAPQNVTLSGNVDLIGTGILGIGRDDNTQTFSGTFDGKGRTITLDIGGKYGDGINTDSGNGSGQVYAKRLNSRDAHYSVALFPYGKDITVKELTVAGSVACAIGNSDQVQNDVRYPILAAAIVGQAEGTTEFNNVKVNADVSVADISNNKNIYAVQGGFLGLYKSDASGNAGTLTFCGCQWTNESTLSNTRTNDYNRIGGFAGMVFGGGTSVTVSGCALSGEIEANMTSNAAVGGLIAESRNDYIKNGGNLQTSDNSNSISISNLTVSDANIRAEKAPGTCGGLLGYKWNKTDVTFAVDTGSNGVTISRCILGAGSNATFGGLVYQATGYWNATAANSIHFTDMNTITGGTSNTAPSGLLVGTGLCTIGSDVSALYLEVGTWGSATGAAYTIDSGAVTLTNTSEYFDELVGKTINTDKDGNAGNNNAVVSLATPDHALIDRTDCNTYTHQLTNAYKNGKTRYYYNLDNYRNQDGDSKSQVNAGSLTTPAQVLSWSVSQYAASNIRDYFCKKDSNDSYNAKIYASKGIDLTGYSYYPVTPLGTVTVGSEGTATTLTLTFAYDIMNAAESAKDNKNKPFNDNTHQHHLMHHGLLYNTGSNVTVKNTTFAGTVGKNSDGSGALIFGSVTGDPTKNPIEVTLTNVTLAGLRVAGVEKGTTTYAPLLINKITQVAKLNVTGLSTYTGYVDESNNTTYAATSLIGRVGDANATKLTLTFTNIALDSRKTASSDNATSVKNNGTAKVEYHTTHTIFTCATLLESFRYSADSSGVYNFNSNDDQVTYGVEISNTSTGRNIDKPNRQYQYYDGGYVWDGLGDTATSAVTIENYFTTTSYLRYVNSVEGREGGYHELDINQKATNLIEGCGTYGDPYIITDGNQLIDLAKFINQQTDVSDFKVTFNETVIQEKKQETGSYHTQGNDENKDVTYTWNGTKWVDKEEKDASTDVINNALSYLLNAYYKISGSIDISIADGSYQGLGTDGNPFSGVITGGIVNIKGTQTTGITNFGGLIRYSRGSVVKDLTVDYTSATITMNNTGIPGKDGNNPFFGGVVGYCMGGDTIIDKVSVRYASRSDGTKSVTLSGNNGYDRLIAAGGYVGLVGGAKDSSDYEKTGGGVVFRNMRNHSNNFKDTLSCASENPSTLVPDSDNYAKKQTDQNYFFCNPYVGRVLDGYACYDGGTAGQSTLNNTDKNYTIPDVPSNDGGLTVTKADDGSLTATVNSAQGLWLLSAIVNSGAGAMDSTGIYQDYDSNHYVEAYQYGKVRSASYEGIGTEVSDKSVALADEAYWGGVASEKNTDDAKKRVSYLVKNFTSTADDGYYYAARLTGKVSSAATNNPVALTFAAKTIDMSPYGNGFRGIGGSYGQKNFGSTSELNNVQRRSLYVTGVSGINTMTKIELAMDQHDYEEEYESKIWSNQGAGLFTVFMYKAGSTDPCQVQNLTISGPVSVRTYNISNGNECGIKKTTYDMGVGGFASRPAKSQDQELKFSNFHLIGLHVNGGTSTGGAIGLVECCGEIEFNDWSIKDSTVYKWVDNDGSTGGLTGWHHSGKSLIINGYRDNAATQDTQNIDNLTVTVKADNKAYGNVGGLTGANDESEVIIQNVNATGLKVIGQKARDIGGLADGGNRTLTIKNCVLTDLTVTDWPDDNGNYDSGSVGGVLGYFKDNTSKIEGVTITGTSTIFSGKNPVGGIVGSTSNTLNMSDCHIIGTATNPVKISSGTSGNHAGGLIGVNNSTTTIKDCTETYVNIFSGNNRAGGLVGSQNNTINASNVTFTNVIVATKKSDRSVGLLTGHTNGKTFNGYNILADSCTVGFNTTATIENLGNITSTGTYNGLWLGGSNGTSTLVAVAVDGKNQPQKDVGATNSGTTKITYADYPVLQDNKDSTSASPWLDVNPQGTLSVKEPASANAQTLTGNGVGYMPDKETTLENSIAHTILTEAKVKKPEEEAINPSTRTYWNVKDASDTSTTFSKFLSESNDVYLTTYQTEETKNGTTNVLSTTDFPILVVNGLAKADKEIWNYIAALTNVASGTEAKGQADSVEVATYQWKGGSFVKKAEGDPSLTVSVDTTTNKKTTISITKNAYDNQQSQFTLLTVKYKNPTTTTTSNADDYFYLYVPVLVKKVLGVSFSAKFLAGTNYRKDAYDSAKGYATAGFDEPVTAYIEYNYDRSKSDWETMLENGDNLLWNYDKVLDLAKDYTDTTKTPLPDGTRLTLVDKRTGQCYIHTFKNKTDTTGDDVNAFDLSTMTVDGSADTAKQFKPVPICDLLGLTIDEQTDTAKTQYVRLEAVNGVAPERATVKVGDTYYRKAKDGDTGDKYTISVGSDLTNNTTGSNYLPQGEGYYLTIQVPSNSGVPVVNNPLSVNSTTMRTTGAPLASIRNPISSNYVIYDGVQQSTFTISTARNGNSTSDTKMEDGDSIRVTLTSNLSLTKSGTENFKNYAPDELDHQFNISMKKYDKNGVASAALIGATGASYTYKITTKQSNSNVLVLYSSESKTINNSEFLDTLTIDCRKNNYDIVTYLKQNLNKTLTIQAVITLPYPTLGTYFPGRSSSDTSDQSGISVSADSRVATATTQLSITTIKDTKEDDQKRYYTENPSSAKLTYNTYDGDGTGDSTRKLGINPSDTINDLDGLIYTNGVYDYSGVDAETLSLATQIKYTLELFQKDDNGSYNESEPLTKIDEYLPKVMVTGDDQFSAGGMGAKTLTKTFSGNTTGFDSINIQIEPLTGAEFEKKNFTYANYKVRLTAVLLDSNQKELTGTKASDYIIYTNARIYQQMISQAELSSTSG